jgi:hypothetical protein
VTEVAWARRRWHHGRAGLQVRTSLRELVKCVTFFITTDTNRAKYTAFVQVPRDLFFILTTVFRYCSSVPLGVPWDMPSLPINSMSILNLTSSKFGGDTMRYTYLYCTLQHRHRDWFGIYHVYHCCFVFRNNSFLLSVRTVLLEIPFSRIMVFWCVAPYNFIDNSRRFLGSYYLYLYSFILKLGEEVSSKFWYLPATTRQVKKNCTLS